MTFLWDENLSRIKHETIVLHQQFFIFLSIVYSFKIIIHV